MFSISSFESEAVTVPPSATCVEIADAMDLNTVGCVVVTEDDRPIGIITDRDLMCRLVAADRDPDKTIASDVMTPDVITASRNDESGKLLSLMAELGVRRLPLVQHGKLVGLVSIDDVLIDVSSHLFNANQGILGGLQESRRTARHRRRGEARENALHELREQLLDIGDEAKERVGSVLQDILDRFGRAP
jgi:signal-transduction protein with cAMP-binding, CBS, and nucleotidyltransferase domain